MDMKKNLLLLFILSSFSVFSQNEYYIETNSDVSNQKLNITEEQKIIIENFPFIPVCEWNNTFKFTSKIKDSELYNESQFYKFNESEKLRNKDIIGKIFYFYSIEDRVDTLTYGSIFYGKNILFTDNNDEMYIYQYKGAPSDFCSEKTRVPRLIFLNDIDKARELFIGQKLYILTDYWRSDDTLIVDDTQKFVPVTILNIGVGGTDGYYKFVFKAQNEKEYFVNIKLSETNTNRSYSSPDYKQIVYMDFDYAFSLKDPKLKYPKITPSTWALIQNGKVKLGMTKTECELSLGVPDHKDKYSDKYGKRETWVYEYKYGGNIYYYFKNGKLTSIQN